MKCVGSSTPRLGHTCAATVRTGRYDAVAHQVACSQLPAVGTDIVRGFELRQRSRMGSAPSECHAARRLQQPESNGEGAQSPPHDHRTAVPELTTRLPTQPRPAIQTRTRRSASTGLAGQPVASGCGQVEVAELLRGYESARVPQRRAEHVERLVEPPPRSPGRGRGRPQRCGQQLGGQACGSRPVPLEFVAFAPAPPARSQRRPARSPAPTRRFADSVGDRPRTRAKTTTGGRTTGAMRGGSPPIGHYRRGRAATPIRHHITAPPIGRLPGRSRAAVGAVPGASGTDIARSPDKSGMFRQM